MLWWGFDRDWFFLPLLPVAVFEVGEKGVVGKKVLVSFAGWVRIEFLPLLILLLRVHTAHMECLRVLLHLHLPGYRRIGLFPMLLAVTG